MPVTIFFCYAREDEVLLNRLKTHLRPLQRQGLIEVWYDREISAGTEWEPEIKEHLNAAQLILLLISPDFMDSDYCYGIEMKRALERHARGDAKVIPIILRPVYWHGEPLGKLQALPTDGKPVTSPYWHDFDSALYNVTNGIYNVVMKLTTPPASASPPMEVYEMQEGIGEYIRQARRQRNLTQTELGGERFSKSYVSAIEQNKIVPSSDALKFFAEQLEQPEDYFTTMFVQAESTTQLSGLSESSAVGTRNRTMQDDELILLDTLPENTEFHTFPVHYEQLPIPGKRQQEIAKPSAVTTTNQQREEITTSLAPFPVKKLSLLHILTGHSDTVNCVTISPDGQILVSGSGEWGDDCTIKVWNLSTGQELRTLASHVNPVNCVTISPDGQILVSGSGEWGDDDGTIKVWNLSTGQELRALAGHVNPVNCVAISPDGQILVSGSEDTTIKVWNLSTGQELRTLFGHAGPVWGVAISPDGQTLVSGSRDTTIKVWNLSTGQELQTFTYHTDAVQCVAISPDGQTLVSGSMDTAIKVWNLSTGQELRTLAGHAETVQCVAISPDGQTLVSGSKDTTIKVWNLSTGQQERTLTGHANTVLSVAISPNGQTMVSGSADTTIKVWRA